jgi:DNA-binding NarL/FixJ family response regulator
MPEISGTAAVEPDSGRGTEALSRPIRVLIADDQPLFADGLRMQLEAQADITCVGVAVDGDRVVELVQELSPDLVLMDIRMPGINGIEATRRITVVDDAPPVVVLTTIRQDEAVYHAMQAGAAGFLTKDATPDQVMATIRGVHGDESLSSGADSVGLVQANAPAVPVREEAIDTLTPREREVFLLLAKGLGNAEIACATFLSEATVKSHVRAVLQKLGLRSRVQVVVYAYENGLVRA